MASILILDDDLTLAQLWTQALQMDGHRVRCYGRSEEALAAFETQPADLIIADMRLMEEDRPSAPGGFLLIAKIWSTVSLRQLPSPRIIAVSGAFTSMRDGMTSLEMLEKYRISHLCLEKPIHLALLKEKVEEVLGSPL